MVEYRILPEAEWPAIADILVEYGGRLPAPGSTVFVAQDDHTIVGFLVLQYVPHVEPIWIHPDYRGRAHWLRLLHMAEAQLSGGTYFAFTPHKHIEEMAEVAGMSKQPWSIYAKEV
jgi:hypothetical protein